MLQEYCTSQKQEVEADVVSARYAYSISSLPSTGSEADYTCSQIVSACGLQPSAGSAVLGRARGYTADCRMLACAR